MQRNLILFVIALLLISTPFAMAQDTPENVREAAINALNQAIPGIGRPDSWRHVGPQSTQQSSLDCAGTSGVELQAPLSYYQVWLTYDSTEYLIHVTADATSFVFCDPKIPGSASYEGGDSAEQPTQVPSDEQVPTTDCVLSTTNANVRVSPSTSAEVVTVITEATDVPVLGRTPESTWWQIGEGWIADIVVTVSGNCDTVPITGAEAIDYGNCPIGFSGYMTSRLAIGEQGRVEDDSDVPNRVRENPTITAQQLFQLEPGDEFTVINGPRCGNGYVWWQVQSTDGRSGWTAESSVSDQEYFVEPIIEGLNAEGEVDFADVQFSYDIQLASDVAFEEIAPEEVTDPEDAPFWAGHPGYREFTFLDFVEENAFDPPAARIRIYPTEAMFEFNELIYDQWVALSGVLQDQTVFVTDTVLQPGSSTDIEPLPALPLRNATQVFATQIRFVEFENGVGIRYITRYAQDVSGTANDMLFYTFQGLTFDNQYYIVADIPISAAILPDTWTPPDPFSVDGLLQEEVDLYGELALLNPMDYTPNLKAIDEIIASLSVE